MEALMPRDVPALKLMWRDMPFFGNRVEEFAARYWYLIILVPYALFVLWGYWIDWYKADPHSFESLTAVIQDPFVSSLGIALFLSAIAFKFWQSTMRETFSTAVDLGVVSDDETSVEKFLIASGRFKDQVRSRLRFMVIAATIIAALIGKRDVIIAAPDFVRTSPLMFTVFQLGALFSNVIFAYAVGAVAWSLITAARWVATLSRDNALRIQLGHSDGCCGLEGIGS